MEPLKHVTADDAFQSRILEEVSRSFAFTIPQLPPALARSVANAYLICRIADTIEDEANLSYDRKQHFFETFIAILHGDAPAQQLADTLPPLMSDRTAPAEHELIRNTASVVAIYQDLNASQREEILRCAEIMSRGMLKFQRMQTLQGLDTLVQMDHYCYYVAGVVGEMLTGLFCDHSPAIAQKRSDLMSLAASFGQGLQMTNIIKDVWEDRERGACWFPRDIFQAAQFDLSNLRPGNDDPRFRAGLERLIGIAHGHLRRALAYTQGLPRQEAGIRKFCIWAVGMAVCTLQQIKNNPTYTCGRDVTISRATTRRIVMASNASIRSNLMLQTLFQVLGRGLPIPESPVLAVPPSAAGRTPAVSQTCAQVDPGQQRRSVGS